MRWVVSLSNLLVNSQEQPQDSSGEGSGDSQEQTPMPEADQSATAPLTDEPEVQTADALESNLQDLVEGKMDMRMCMLRSLRLT